MKLSLLMILGALTAGAGLADAQEGAPQPVAVLYDGNTPVNSDTLHFLDHRIKETHSAVQLVPVQNPADIQPGRFRAVVVLNTGLEAGINRRLAGFITAWQPKGQVILVTLRRGSSAPKVEVQAPSPATLGVDAVTAASKWEGKGLGAFFGGGSDLYKMHAAWADQVLAFVTKVP